VGYVLIPFVVTDVKGRSRRDLKAADVTLLVDGKAVSADLFERTEGAPVSFTILLDGSGSMGLMGKIEGSRAAIAALLDARRPGDDYALHVFSQGKIREVVSFTRDVAAVRRAVRDLVPFGKTALFDALARMPDQSLLGRNGVRAVILLTDGVDNASDLKLEQLDEVFSGVDVPVYPVGIRTEGGPAEPSPGAAADKTMNVRILGDLARMSGGRLAIVEDPARLPEAIAEIDQDLRSQYVIGFTPTGTGEVKFRRISLRINGPAYRLRVRAGYRGTEPPERVAR
jgi:Ca-activated chloride channel family protein